MRATDTTTSGPRSPEAPTGPPSVGRRLAGSPHAVRRAETPRRTGHRPGVTFLPLTLATVATLRATPATAQRAEHAGLVDRTHHAEQAARDSWQALLGGCACPRRRQFPDSLRLLTRSAGDYTGASWWDGSGGGRRDRVTSFEHWAIEALAEGDGAGFAGACAGYDAALAGALVSAPAAN